MKDPLKPTVEALGSNSNAARDSRYEVTWEPFDAENPQNWSLWQRVFIVASMSYSTTVVVIYSTMYTSGVDGIRSEFEISSKIVVLLGLTTNLFGLALGSVVLSSLSEIYGRRPVYITSVLLFALFIVPVAMAKNIETILISRFFGGFFGGAMIASAPGSVTDVTNEQHRALALSFWSLGTMNGPVLGPIIGGFVFQYLGWRWLNWIVLIGSGVSFSLMLLVQETYAPALLRKRTKAKQRATRDRRWWCCFDHQDTALQVLKTNLIRPLRMVVLEPICIFWNLYVGIVYAVLFLCFVAYPIVFQDHRSWAAGLAGLGYCGIGTGTVIAVLLEPMIRRMIDLHPRDLATGRPTPEATVIAICIGSILIPIGEIWFAWTARPSVHWISPILAGIPFGMGNGFVFIYATSYIAGSYTVYAASALAGNSVVRYGLAGLLPLAGDKMYSTLGPDWASTMLALIEFALIPIPFIFYRYGHHIRLRSPMIAKREVDGC